MSKSDMVKSALQELLAGGVLTPKGVDLLKDLVTQALSFSTAHTAKHGISVSSIKSYLSCRRAFNWSSSIGGNLEPKAPSLPFFTGSTIHTALEAYYESGVPLRVATEQALMVELAKVELKNTNLQWGLYETVLEEQEELSLAMMYHYHLWVNGKLHHYDTFADSTLEFLAVETAFKVPVKINGTGGDSPHIYLRGRFDGVVLYKPDNSIWLFENKTSGRPSELEDSLDNDLQTTAYVYALEQLLGIPVKGVIYNVMYKKAPTEPKVLKSGSLSQAKNLSTTFEAYLEAIRTTHEGITDANVLAMYGGMLDHLKAEGNKYFKRLAIIRTKEEVESFSKYLYHVGLEMVRPSTTMYPNPSYHSCKWCKFKVPCLGLERGEDITPVLASEYIPRSEILVGFKVMGFKFEPVGVLHVEEVPLGNGFLVFFNEHTVTPKPMLLTECLDSIMGFLGVKDTVKVLAEKLKEQLPDEADKLDKYISLIF